MAGKIESIITMDGKQPIKVLQLLLDKAKELSEQMKQMKPGTEEYKEAEAKVKALQSAQVQTIKTTERLEAVVNDLSNTSLRNLRRALGEGKRKLEGLSEAEEEEAKHIRSLMKEVGDEVRLLEGKYVKIEKGLKNIGNQSDQWLSKALTQQRELVASLEKTDASYLKNCATLKQLEMEEDRRNGKLTSQQAMAVVQNPISTASELRRAKTSLTQARDDVDTSDTAQIKAYNDALAKIEERLDAVSGKTQKAAISWQKMRQVLSNPGKASGEDIKQTMDAIQQKIQQLPAGSKAVSDLRRQYAQLEQTMKGTRLSQAQINDIVARSKTGKANINELRQAYKQLEEELNFINTKSETFANRQKELKNLKKVIDDATGAANKQSGAWHTALKYLTAYVGMFAVFNQVKTYFVDLFRLNMKFMDQLTDIRKVALSTTDEIANLSRELAKIDTRTSLEELNRIAYAGAKLGIQTQGGTMALAGFVRAADQVNVALKEDLGEEALTSLAKITEVMGLVDKYGVEKAMLKTGSAIFRLAATSTASSDKIVDFSNRMLALGEQAALTTPDILALGSAVDSMALEPEVAATAFGKLVTELRKGTSPIEKSLGIATGSLKKMIESGRGMDAILTIFRKMGETKNVFALDGLFKDLGSDGARLVKTMVTMAAKNGMLTKAVEESNKAFNDGTAVTVEYNMQQETAMAYMERANNLWEKQFVSASEASGPVHDIAKAWFEVTKELTSSIGFMTEVRIAISLIFASVKMLLNILPTLITTISMAGLAGGFAKLLTYLQGVEAASLSLGAVWTKMQTTFNKLSFVKQAGVIGGVIGLLGILVVKLAEFTSSLNRASAGQRVLNEVQEEGKRKAMEEQEQLKRLHNVMNDTSASMKLRLEAMNKLNGAIPNLNAKIDSETGAVKENTKAWDANFTRLQKYYELEGARAKLAELGRQKVDAILDLQKKEDAYANSKVETPNGTYIQTSGGAMMPSQVQGAIGQAGQRAAAKSARDKAQRRLDDILAQEQALSDKFGAELDVADGKETGTPQRIDETKGGSVTKPEDDARNNISEFITKIKNFYERQKTAMIEQMTKDNVEKEIQKQVVNDIDIQLKAALASAKQSIVLGKNTWDEFKKTMDKDRKEKDDEFGQSQSRTLLEQINAYSVSKLRADLLKQMPKIKKGKIVGYKSDERDRAYLDRQWLDASKGEKSNASIIQERMEQRRKELLEHDYTKVVQENSFLGLIKSRFADVSLDSLQKDKNDVIKVLEKARTQIADLFATEGKKENLLKFLFGENYENTPSVFLALLNDTEEDVKLFYQKLIQYSDEYVAAEKKQYDEAKKISDFMWKRNQRNLANQEALRKMQQESSLFGKRTNLLSNLGLADFTADPEVELMKLKMQMAEDYYAFVFKNSRNQQLIDEADRARQEAELAYVNQMATAMKNRLSQMQSLVQPIETFGAEVGKAFAEMRNDVSSAQEAIKNALKSMLESWVQMGLNDVKTQMWKAINDAGAKRGKKKAQPGIDAARANADANAIKEDFSNLGTKSNPMYVRLVDEGAGYLTPQPQSSFEGMAPQQQPLGWNPDGSPITPNNQPVVPYAPADTKQQGTPEQQNGAPRAWSHRNRDNADAFYNDAGSMAGSAIADAATGNGGSFSDVAAGITGSAIGGVMNTEFNVGGKKDKGDDDEAARKKQLKNEKKHQKEMARLAKQGMKERKNINKQGTDAIVKTSDEGNSDMTRADQIKNKTLVDAGTSLMNTQISLKKKGNDEQLQSDADLTRAQTTFSIVGAIGKCFAFLGPIAGPIAAAVVMATLNGLLQWALGSAFSKKSKSSSSPNTKLTTGMLTYDNGNVQDLKPFVDDNGELYWMADDNDKEYGKKPFMADNGEVYWAREDDGKQMQGVKMLTSPTAITVNGQPSLVAERGPEIVIGRETTHAMMMNNPGLLKALVNYDRNYSGRNSARRAFDDGNVSDVLAADTQAGNGNLSSGASATGDLIAANAASNAALLQAVNALIQRLNEPINAKINMYGRDGLHDSLNKANQFMKHK